MSISPNINIMDHAQRPVEMTSEPDDPHHEKMKPDFLSANTAEKSNREQGHMLTAATMPSATSNDTATEANLKGSSEEQHAEQDDEEKYPRGLTFVLLTIGLMAVVLVVAMDNYIIATAIPRITTDFDGLDLVGWYGSSYFLTLMSFQPAFGQLCTLFSIKPVYLISIVVFEIGSTISASAPTSVPFIIGRLVSGAAGGGLWCGTLTVMGQVVPARQRHLYVSVVTSMYGVASAAGPLLGGVFTDSSRLTWRFCFWVNLPIGFVAFVTIAIFLKPPPRSLLARSLSPMQKVARIDFGGAFLLIAAFVCLLLALQWGGTTYAWSESRVWGCVLGFGLISLAFIALQIQLKNRATIPLRIISKRNAAAGCAFTTFMSMAIGVHVYYLPFYFQSVLGTTAAQSGIRTLPYLMTLLLSPMISGSLIMLVGHYVPFMWAGATLTTIGSGLLFTLSTRSSTGQWIGYQFVAAFGAGICRQIPFSAVPLVLADDDLAIASALIAFCNSLGPTLAIGIGQSIFTSEFLRQLAQIPGINGRAVMNAGAANLGVAVPGPLLGSVRQAFDYALTRAFVVAIASAGAALCCSLAMEWLSVKESR